MGDHPKSPRAAQTIRARAAEVIEKQRDKMRKTIGAAIDGRDPEGVHDMRVASRRLRAALAVFEPWLEGDRVRESRRAVGGDVFEAAGEVRGGEIVVTFRHRLPHRLPTGGFGRHHVRAALRIEGRITAELRFSARQHRSLGGKPAQ